MADIIEFLETRISEDEAAARVAQSEFAHGGYGSYGPSRVLAECAAKRAIIDECRSSTLSDLDSGEDDQPAPMWVARALAAVYKDHPDYQQEWAA